MNAMLLDTGPICYTGNDRQLVWRPARTWDLGGGTVLTIVSETCEPTMSIETAAEQIRDLLDPGVHKALAFNGVRIVEHWPEGIGTNRAEHYAEQFRDGGRIRWEHITAETLRGLLGDTFDATMPTGPVTDGTYPSRATQETQ